MPGAGKTMLASLVIDHLQQCPVDGKVTITYIYCDYRRQDEQTPLNLIASLTKQSLQHQDFIPEDVMKMYQLHCKKQTRPRFEEMLEMIGSSTAHSSRVYVIVDALDELGNAGQVRQTLIGHLRPLQDLYHFSLMTTSRYIPSLALDFHQPLCMDIRASVEDVRRYVEGHIVDLPSCVRNSLELQETIASAIVDVVEGMFLLAQLHMDSLRDKTSPKMIKKALEKLPKGSNALDLAYDGAMQRIQSQMEGFQLQAKQLLGWLTYSERLMTVEEVQHALAIEPGTPDLDQDNLSDVHETVAFCAGLIIIDEETQIIRLAHYTTQNYFRRNGDSLLAHAQQDIAINCLTYLLYENFGQGWVQDWRRQRWERGRINRRQGERKEGTEDKGKDKKETEDKGEDESEDEGEDEGEIMSVMLRLQRYPFLGYAAKYWATHSTLCGQRIVQDLTLSFLKDDRRVSSASQVLLENWFSPITDENLSHTPLSEMHFVAYLGHEELISELLSHGFDADARDSHDRTPLWWAASQGHEAVVSLLLLQSNVNVNSRGGYHNRRSEHVFVTPLGIAADRGKDKIVKLLIQHEDVDVNMPNSDGDSPLITAVHVGTNTTVELLLTRRDIEVNCRNNRGETPLYYAAWFDKENVAQQLLEQKDIQVNLADNDGYTPLATAAFYGLESMMDVLLSRSDIEVNAPDKYGQTPLFKAVDLHREAAVKLLLSRSDVDVTWKDHKGRTPLARAIIYYHAVGVRLLCAHPDVDLDPRDNEGRDVFALAEEQRERISRFNWKEEDKAEQRRKLDKCMDILRTAIETRTRNEPRVLDTVLA